MYNKRRVLHDIRKNMKAGCSLSIAIDKAGVKSRTTIQSWGEENPRIKRFIGACKELSENKRNDAVEDAFFKRLIGGEAAPTDYIFYLTNRIPNRWKHSSAIINNVIQNRVENNQRMKLTNEELDAVLSRFAKTN